MEAEAVHFAGVHAIEHGAHDAAQRLGIDRKLAVQYTARDGDGQVNQILLQLAPHLAAFRGKLLDGSRAPGRDGFDLDGRASRRGGLALAVSRLAGLLGHTGELLFQFGDPCPEDRRLVQRQRGVFR